ncbi:uncharacterized protein KY384_005491 [Bacidia gigantensis]|uniref:uncharacterized protein n=1 Tax=Bacidia gigantensis TaxID=2732470 RepID=UPI001D050163|nr:uncharacterized protein KY384_005491 [Bacidia gigantensis]KAG8530009.1 hypothetical protein KY384_005491 [Bacidia gigantensis]
MIVLRGVFMRSLRAVFEWFQNKSLNPAFGQPLSSSVCDQLRKMAPEYKVALIQLYAKPVDAEDNFNRASIFIHAAAAQGAHLAVLPEYHLTSWIPRDPKFKEICAQWSVFLARYQGLAAECDISIVPGTIVELHKDEVTGEETLQNVAYFIDNGGKILSRYQKKNLWHPERKHLVSSTYDPHDAFDTPLGKVGLLVCWDLAFPEAFRELIAKGAKTVIIPTFWGINDCSEYARNLNLRTEALLLESMLTARAFENTCCVIFVNAGAPPGDLENGAYAGLSRVTLPFVGAKGEETMKTTAEGMSIVTIDMEIVEEAEKNYRVRADLGAEGWHYTYRHEDKSRL